VSKKIPYQPLDIVPLAQADVGRCVGCGRRPRRLKRKPLAVWMGRPEVARPGTATWVCVCAVCLAAGLERLGLLMRIPTEEEILAEMPPPEPPWPLVAAEQLARPRLPKVKLVRTGGLDPRARTGKKPQ
jgi:hypothetical protein